MALSSIILTMPRPVGPFKPATLTATSGTGPVSSLLSGAEAGSEETSEETSEAGSEEGVEDPAFPPHPVKTAAARTAAVKNAKSLLCFIAMPLSLVSYSAQSRSQSTCQRFRSIRLMTPSPSSFSMTR